MSVVVRGGRLVREDSRMEGRRGEGVCALGEMREAVENAWCGMLGVVRVRGSRVDIVAAGREGWGEGREGEGFMGGLGDAECMETAWGGGITPGPPALLVGKRRRGGFAFADAEGMAEPHDNA